MRYFLDTEFNERPGLLELISLGIVAEDGRELYIEARFDPNNSNEWVRKNVWPHLKNPPVRKGHYFTLRTPNANYNLTQEAIKEKLLDFFFYFGDTSPKIWTYYGAYDWVIFCWQFGSMIDLPDEMPMYPRDLKYVLDRAGITSIPDELKSKTEHNALADAKFNQRLWQWLRDDFNILLKY
jgi:hypothetical protein